MRGLRVLAMLAPGNTDETRYVVAPLEAAKARWGWTIDILCEPKDKKVYAALAAPSGRIFAQPTNKVMEQPAPWEADPRSVADVDENLREAELASGLSAGRVILAGAHTIGRAFVSPVIRLTDTAITSRVLHDNTEPSRIVRRLFKFADDMLESASPDFVFTYEWAKPWRLAVLLAALRRGIPCVAVRRSKIRSSHCFVTSDPLMINVAAIERAAERRKTEVPISQEALTYIRSFRDQPQMVKYVQTKWQLMGQKSWLSWHLGVVRTFARQLMRRGKGQRKATRKSTLKLVVDYNRRFLLMPRQKRFFHQMEAERLAHMKYVYFAMHKETDLPLTFQAALWSDQRNTVGLLASLLPNGYRLLVREHRLNFGFRPSRYYRDLARLPNVTLIDPFDSQFKYLRNAALIVTENGSSGWEGLLLRRRVLTVSRTFYDGAGLACQVLDPSKLGPAILDLLARPERADTMEYDRHLGCMIDAETETTFPMGFQPAAEILEQFGNLLSPLIFPRAAAPGRSYARVDPTAHSMGEV